MTLIARNREQKRLNAFFNANEARLLALYGRRRVGKTYLIENFFKPKNCVFFQATGVKNGGLSRQVGLFVNEISQVFYQGAPLQYKNDWFMVFELLTKALGKESTKIPIVLFLDEFPWLATQKSHLIEAFEYFWNRHWHSMNNVRFILCGSNSSWIIKKIINNTEGLHQRVTDKINLRPFNLAECKKYLEYKKIKLNDAHILNLYMVFGGIPLYLNQIQKNLTSEQNIDNICFSRDGLLFNELNELFGSLFQNAEQYVQLAETISLSPYGLSQGQIAKKTNVTAGGTLSERLKKLEDCGFIVSFVPYGNNHKGQYYKIQDPYITFYFKWIKPAKSALEKLNKPEGYWLSKSQTSSYHAWSDIAFEAVCYLHINQIRKALSLTASALPYGWRYIGSRLKTGAQIDLLFIRGDNAITICEIKFSRSPYTITKVTAQNLKQKIEIFKQVTNTKKQLFTAMICTYGLKPNLYSDELISSVVTLDNLFAHLS